MRGFACGRCVVDIVFYPIVAMLVIVFFLVRAEIRGLQRQIYILKPLATLLVISVALLSLTRPIPNLAYLTGVLIGLLFSLGGDMALMFPQNRKAFMIGLALFLLAHVAYTVVFILVGSLSAWDLLSVVVLLAVGIAFYRLIQPKLGAMRIPVVVYMIVISLMVNRAVSTLASPQIGLPQALLIVFGAILFYISDLILAAGRFWKPWKYHRISLAFYYSGQLLIALSAGI